MANESLPEVIAEMRERAEAMEIHGTTRGVKRTVLEFANRIEAAAGKIAVEHKPACPTSPAPTPGNAAAMREALVKIRDIAKTFMDATIMRHVTDSARIDVANIEALVDAALSAPPRNCDIGTAEEQYYRHDKYCSSQPTCRKCLRDDAASMCISCFAKWAQRPYEAEEGGAK